MPSLQIACLFLSKPKDNTFTVIQNSKRQQINKRFSTLLDIKNKFIKTCLNTVKKQLDPEPTLSFLLKSAKSVISEGFGC